MFTRLPTKVRKRSCGWVAHSNHFQSHIGVYTIGLYPPQGYIFLQSPFPRNHSSLSFIHSTYIKQTYLQGISTLDYTPCNTNLNLTQHTTLLSTTTTPPTPSSTVTLSPSRITTYYIYPKQPYGHIGGNAYEYITVTRRPSSPTPSPSSTPPLVHSNTSTPLTRSPSTANVTMARGPTSSQRIVGFASEVQSIRQPREDELSVISHFARHADRCPYCHDPYAAYIQDKSLCDRGISLAKDVCNYLYAKGGKPFSIVDRQSGDRVQVQIPAGMEAVSLLIKAISRGMVLKKKPAVVVSRTVDADKIERTPYQSSRLESALKSPRPKEYTEERRYHDGPVEIVERAPRRQRVEQAYHSDRVGDRSRYERRERPMSVIYPEEKRGSLYQRDEEEKRQRRQYEREPIVIVAEPRPHRYISRRFLN